MLRRIFVNADDNDVKGLAAKIKADEITVKDRIRAVRYLATVDSGAYPEAKCMLINTLHNDKWEEVRFEAARALRLMMAGNASGAARTPRLFRMWFRKWRRHTRRRFRTSVRGRRDFNSNPCDPVTLNALIRTAYELNPNGTCFEPSARIRAVAVMTIRDSGVACDVGPYFANASRQSLSGFRPHLDAANYHQPASQPVPPNPDGYAVQTSERHDGISDPNNDLFAPFEEPEPPVNREADRVAEPATIAEAEKSAIGSSATPEPPATPASTPAAVLEGNCVVALWYGQRLPALSEFRTVYQDRLYHFSSAAALAEFDTDPEQYALAYGGFDPVAYASRQEMVEGTLLKKHEGFFYCFASEENWNEFQARPDLYALRFEDLLTDEEYFALVEQEAAKNHNRGAEEAAPTDGRDQHEAQLDPREFAPQGEPPQAVEPVAEDEPTEDSVLPINLVPPPPAGVEEEVAGLDPDDFESPFADDNPLDFADPEEGIADASRVLGLSDFERERSGKTVAPVPPQAPVKGASQQTPPTRKVATEERLQEASHTAQLLVISPREADRRSDVYSWSDLGLDNPAQAAAGATEPSSPSRPVAPVEQDRLVAEPTVQQIPQVERASSGRAAPQSSKPGPASVPSATVVSWGSLITKNDRQLPHAARRSRFEEALTDSSRGFHVTPITQRALTTRVPQRHVTQIRLGDRSSVRPLEPIRRSTRSALRPVTTPAPAIKPSRQSDPRSQLRRNQNLVQPGTLIRPARSSVNSALTRRVGSARVTAITRQRLPGDVSDSETREP